MSRDLGSSEDLLTPFKDDQLDLEGNDVTLSCNYSGTVTLLLWYRQTPSSSPQLVTSGYSDTTGRLSLRHEKTRKTFHLLISSAAVTDSAVYYCALQPTVTGNTRTLYKNLQYSTAATRGMFESTLEHLKTYMLVLAGIRLYGKKVLLNVLIY
uniref:Ig-like domain-containing protein n=1 Tax=Xiphophorus maculatus TaxID=8083 RepID=A0A3B5RBG4_XIPMA